MKNAEIIAVLADAIRAYAMGDDSAGGTAIIALASSLAKNGAAQGATKKSATEARRGTAKRVFAYWQERCDHPKARMTADRLSKVLSRIKEGYTEADLRTAIDGAAEHAYVNDDTGIRYDDLALICQSGSKLESFIQRGQAANGGDVHVDSVSDAAGGLELQIGEARRRMAAAYKNDDQATYRKLEAQLSQLMEQRS